MDMDKAASSLDTTDNPGADIQRLDSASSFHTVAPKAAPCSFVDFGESRHISNPTATGTDITRLIDFMKRSKWKIYQSYKRGESVVNYLSVIDMGM